LTGVAIVIHHKPNRIRDLDESLSIWNLPIIEKMNLHFSSPFLWLPSVHFSHFYPLHHQLRHN